MKFVFPNWEITRKKGNQEDLIQIPDKKTANEIYTQMKEKAENE